ncbi:MAG: DUF2894 domain-containing protein [Candidatus Accumulibacter sp.]|uniref:DUF2894 domain-containing protein n=1 Tax=Candidatus Accumulibacter affinis TaxID=2954384 RepID=A0A935W4K4_9PROT|nr:DUF2894 domain-containing protein [Candidatus Accumulibacter affinis]
MTESDRGEISQSQVDPASDPGREIARLRMQGADRLDPVRFHFIEALARRVRQHQGDVKRILNGKLTEALTAYRERLEQTQEAARETIARTTEQYLDVADDLQRLFVAGDFSGVERFVAKLEKNERHSSLADLTRYIAQHSPEDVDGGLAGDIGSHSELKSMRYFRNTWAKLSVDRRVAQAIEQGPKNAGPLNSHRLVLRSFALMRDISPDYLNRFVSYVDTLLWLDQADRKNRPMVKKPLTTKTTRI